MECQEVNGVACRDNPICTCQKGFKVVGLLKKISVNITGQNVRNRDRRLLPDRIQRLERVDNHKLRRKRRQELNEKKMVHRWLHGKEPEVLPRARIILQKAGERS